MRHLLAIVVPLAVAAQAAAQGGPFVPDVVAFAGTLDRSGAPVNATVTVSAVLYDGADGAATALGALADDASVVVVDGVFVLELPGLLALVGAERAWLELVIDGETLAPRAALGAVPWAGRAAAAPWDGLVGVPAELLDGDDQSVSPGDLTAVAPVQISGDQITIRADSIAATHLAASSVGTSEIANGSITSADFGYGVVGVDEIGTDAVGLDEMRNSSVGSAEIVDDTITAADIAYGTIGANEIGFDAVGAAELDTGAVDTDALVNGAVTDVKLASSAVTRSTIWGTEVSVRQIDNSYCEGVGGLTTATFCWSRACGGTVSGTDVTLRYYSCAGACNQSSPVSCTLSTPAGFLLSESIP
ncbi:MAG: hypothetical protein HYS27_07365 [Deltaproteobacteria bacterium]|nr:hypothetical protein [Deltaproteobacteria bacterium]